LADNPFLTKKQNTGKKSIGFAEKVFAGLQEGFAGGLSRITEKAFAGLQRGFCRLCKGELLRGNFFVFARQRTRFLKNFFYFNKN
jgi:hypothetical protein